MERVSVITSQVGDALDYAHAQGVIHRDVKPSNILVDPRGNCMLTDFGIGKILMGSSQLTRTGEIFGTPAYMSPEQGLGKDLDGRSDVYALGVIVYEMLTGRQPFRAETPMAVIVKHINDPLPLPQDVNPKIPETIQNVVLKALAKERDYRYSTAGELVASINAAMTMEKVDHPLPTVQISEDVVSIPPTEKIPQTRPQKAAPRHQNLPWILMGIAAFVVIGVLLVLGYFGMKNHFRSDSLAGEPTKPATPIKTEQVTLQLETETAQPRATDPETPAVVYEFHPNQAAYVFNKEGLEPITAAIQWTENPTIVDRHQAELIAGQKGEFEQVARLSVRGYGHGDQTAWVTVELDIPETADIVLIPVATSLNGTVDETDSESALEIRISNPDTGEESWTYALYLYETALGVPYTYAFADASPFRNQKAYLMIRLRQIDVCAGTQCTHDADFFIGDLYYGLLPDLCTRLFDGSLLLYDYYDDPTPEAVADCALPQSYHFLDIEEGPYNQYGIGESEYPLSFDLPENATLIDFRLYYGYRAKKMIINDQVISPEDLYEAFPIRSGVYHNIAEPSRYSLYNQNTDLLAPYFKTGANHLLFNLYAENTWEESPFDLFMRFKVPVP
jgi:hypothetical protein